MTDTAPHLRAIDGASDAVLADEPVEDPKGLTRPQLGGGASRFLTDVLADLGYCERKRVDRAVEESRSQGVSPERVLLGAAAHAAEVGARLHGGAMMARAPELQLFFAPWQIQSTISCRWAAESRI